MAIKYNIFSSIGDSAVIKADFPIAGIDTIYDYSDSVLGETLARFFIKEFRYSLDGVIFTDWVHLTKENLQKIIVNDFQIFSIEYKYTRSGSDNTGELKFNSVSLSVKYHEIINPSSYRESFLNNFFDINDENNLKWSLNVLNKLYNSSILPSFIKRSDDFIKFWGIVTHWFAILVNYSRSYENIRGNYDLLYDYLRQKGLILKDKHTEQELNTFLDNLFIIFRERGTIKSFNADCEYDRLINKEEFDEFIFSNIENKRGSWYLNCGSPIYRGSRNVLNFIKGLELTEGVTNLSSYPISEDDSEFVSIITEDDKNVIKVDVSTGVRGISYDPDKSILIDSLIPYEITAYIKCEDDEDTINSLIFGVIQYDLDKNILDSLSSVDGSVIVGGYQLNGAEIISNKKVLIRGIIYGYYYDNISADDAKLNIGQGVTHKFSQPCKYISPFIKSQGSGGVLNNLLIYDLKIRPLNTPFSWGFLNLNNFTLNWLYNRNSKLSKNDLAKDICCNILPYKWHFQPIWIDELNVTGINPLVISSLFYKDITCHNLNNGIIEVTASGGVAPYQYSVDGINYFNDNLFDTLSAGNYRVRVKDSNGVIVISDLIQIINPDQLIIDNITLNQVSKYGNEDGSIIMDVSGGVKPYLYSILLNGFWSAWQSSNIFIGLSPNTYKVKFTDYNSCTPVESNDLIIVQPEIPDYDPNYYDSDDYKTV